MKRKLFCSDVMTETNSFSNIPTTYESFAEMGIRRGRDLLYGSEGEIRSEVAWLQTLTDERNFELVGGLFADAAPGAPIQHGDYLRLKGELLQELRDCMPVDAVFLNLHGAMMSTECDDCEGDMLEAIRVIVGSNVPVGVVLDPHAHLTAKMVGAASVMAFMKEYPHVDGAERGAEVISMLSAMLEDALHPEVALLDCELMGFFPTQDEPMRSFVDGLQQREQEPDVLSISFVHGFPWGDCSEAGAKILVYTDGDQQRAQEVARDVQRELWSIKDNTGLALSDYRQAVAHLQSVSSSESLPQQPIILADVSDNPGGGAPSDSTYLLSQLLAEGIQNVAVGLIYDPEAVKFCHQVGVGGQLDLRLGGKLSQFSGLPMDLSVVVKGLASEAQMDVAGIVEFPMGDTAWVHCQGIDVVLSSVRTQMYAPSGFSHLGLKPASKFALVVKSSNHFRAFFADIAGEIIDVSTPGAINFDYEDLPYKQFTGAFYPRDRVSGEGRMLDLDTERGVQ